MKLSMPVIPTFLSLSRSPVNALAVPVPLEPLENQPPPNEDQGGDNCDFWKHRGGGGRGTDESEGEESSAGMTRRQGALGDEEAGTTTRKPPRLPIHRRLTAQVQRFGNWGYDSGGDIWKTVYYGGARWKDNGIWAWNSGWTGVRELGEQLRRATIEGRYLEKGVHFSTLFSSFAVLATSKMEEEEREAGGQEIRVWEVTFIIFYIVWGFSVATSLYLDWLQSRTKVFNTVSHIGCCAIILYFFASILSIKTPTTVLPICINLGLLASAGVQKISPGVKDRIFTWIGTCLGMPYQPGEEEDDA